MSAMGLFLQKLQASKKFIQKPEALSVEQRAELLMRLAQDLRKNSAIWASLDPMSGFFSEGFYLEVVLRGAARQLERVASEVTGTHEGIRASGVHSIVLGRQVFLPAFFEILGSSLAAGNAVLCHATSEMETFLSRVRINGSAISPDAEGCFEFVIDDKGESLALFLGHPGVRAVSVTGRVTDTLARELGAPQAWLEKKWQIFRGGKSTAVVLADADLEKAADGILRAVTEGQGVLPWSISRLIVVESVEEKLREILKNKLTLIKSQADETTRKRQNQLLTSLQSEKARELLPGAPVTILENVSNCSEYHQIELESPVLFWIGVKYAFDAAKWVNNLPNSLGVQFWGSSEKVEKLLPKIETAQVWREGWIENQKVWSQGMKASFAGIADPRWDGYFYSEKTNL